MKTTIETQLPGETIVKYKPVKLLPLPKGSVRGGKPSGIDQGGPPRFLGCEYVRKGDLLTKYSFEVLSPCYEDDTKCLDTAPVYEKPEARSPVDEELARCETPCAAGDTEKCLIYSTAVPPDGGGWPVGNKLYALYDQLVKSTPPIGLNMSALFGAIQEAGGESCPNRMLTINEAGEALASGPGCRPSILIPQGGASLGAESIALDVPSVLAGTFHQSTSVAKLQFQSDHAMSLEFFQAGNREPVNRDFIAAMYFSKDRILVSGKNKVCMRIDYRAG